MKELTRSPAPAWLQAKYKEWGKDWKRKYAMSHRSSDFHWRQHNNCGYDDLVRELSAMTNKHCAFCDAYPMGPRLQYTVEHFRPKTQYPLLAYTWGNLFLCCRNCQDKSNAFDKRLLKPDRPDYRFDDYFEIDWMTGELRPNPLASPENQERAEITITLYRLNENGKPEDRLAELEKFLDSRNPELEKWAYRFFIERGV